jgi:hypothetical protein
MEAEDKAAFPPMLIAFTSRAISMGTLLLPMARKRAAAEL